MPYPLGHGGMWTIIQNMLVRQKKGSHKICLDLRNKIQTEVNANVVSCIVFFFQPGVWVEDIKMFNCTPTLVRHRFLLGSGS